MEPVEIDMKYVSAVNIALAAMVIVSYAAAGALTISWIVAVAVGLALSFMTARRIAFTHMPLKRPWLLLLPVGLTLLAAVMLWNGAAASARWIAVAMAYLAGSHIAYLRQRWSA